jgi:transcriptional regulator with XRE-family HTH domain
MNSSADGPNPDIMTPMGKGETDDVRRHELAAFLRARREALQPGAVGLAQRGRRRVKGLRRDEVAELACVSVTWYTWLEQARDIRTSSEVLDAIARALQLDSDAHVYLRRLAQIPVADLHRVAPSAASAAHLALMEDLLPSPALLTTPTADLIAWNSAYAKLVTDPALLPLEHRNGLWIQLCCSEMRQRMKHWERETEALIACFRAEAGKFPGNERIARLIVELSDRSEFFRVTWERHQVKRFTSARETFVHSLIGEVHAELLQLRLMDQPSLNLMVHRLADDDSRAKMWRLLEGSTTLAAAGM